MKNLAASLAFLLLASGCGQAQQSVEEIAFQSGSFHLVGDLQLPDSRGVHPVVVFVHGDGPNNRTSGVTYPPIMARMLRAGYATFAWDKPGTGESTGRIDRQHLMEQRAQIVLDAIAVLQSRSDIDANRIGLWGISQAGYVMPLVVDRSEDVAFVIAVSCPGEPGVEQGAYLLTAQARCQGLPAAAAEQLEYHLGAVEWATTYEEYVRHKTALQAYPAFTSLESQGIFVGVRAETEWHVPNLAGEYFFDPMDIVQRTTIPVLAVFGEKDTQADPIQGRDAYRAALEQGGHTHSRVELIPGVDHNIIISETGCLEERRTRSRSGWSNYAPAYLDLVEEWLRTLRVARDREGK
jgi:pimeloyl-ACP methyl ester carboxylesterase